MTTRQYITLIAGLIAIIVGGLGVGYGIGLMVLEYL